MIDSTQSTNYDTQNDFFDQFNDINLSGLNLNVGTNKIIAGSTMKQFIRNNDNTSILINSNENIDNKILTSPHTYSNCDASTFLLRVGPNYTKFKKKAPSLKSLYEVVGVDFVRCTERIDNFASKVQIPNEWTNNNNIVINNLSIPSLFVINAQLPEDFSTSFFTSTKEDGVGWSLVVYFQITKETCEALKDLNTASPAIKLFAKYCKEAPEAFSINQTNNTNNCNTNNDNNNDSNNNNNDSNNTTNITNTSSKICSTTSSTTTTTILPDNLSNSNLPVLVPVVPAPVSTPTTTSSKLLSKAMSFSFSSAVTNSTNPNNNSNNTNNNRSSSNSSNSSTISFENPWIGRFKMLLRCDDIEKFGLPSFITSYNAKPVLIRNTGTLIRGANYLEMDINIHKFASVPKKALEVLFHRFDQMKISIGFCIESREEDEMPEILLGAVKINLPSYQKAYNWNNVTL